MSRGGDQLLPARARSGARRARSGAPSPRPRRRLRVARRRSRGLARGPAVAGAHMPLGVEVRVRAQQGSAAWVLASLTQLPHLVDFNASLGCRSAASPATARPPFAKVRVVPTNPVDGGRLTREKVRPTADARVELGCSANQSTQVVDPQRHAPLNCGSWAKAERPCKPEGTTAPATASGSALR